MMQRNEVCRQDVAESPSPPAADRVRLDAGPSRYPARPPQLDIETLRGVAIILMVMGHVIGPDANSGIRVADQSIWRHFYDLFAPFRMPLFTVIAGYVYALHPVRLGKVLQFIRTRMRRLIPPLVVGTLLFVGIRQIVPGSNHQLLPTGLWAWVSQPQGHFWYIYAMVWISLLTIPLELLDVLSTPRRLSVLLVVLSALGVMGIPTGVFALSNTANIVPFFFYGIGMARFWNVSLRSTRARILLVVLTASLAAVHQAEWFGVLNVGDAWRRLTIVSLGFASVGLAFALRRPNRWLAALGGYSYGIYLLHVHGTAGARIGLGLLGCHSLPILFLAGTCGGLLLPVAAEVLGDRFSWIRLLVFGRTKPIQSRLGATSQRNTSPPGPNSVFGHPRHLRP